MGVLVCQLLRPLGPQHDTVSFLGPQAFRPPGLRAPAPVPRPPRTRRIGVESAARVSEGASNARSTRRADWTDPTACAASTRDPRRYQSPGVTNHGLVTKSAHDMTCSRLHPGPRCKHNDSLHPKYSTIVKRRFLNGLRHRRPSAFGTRWGAGLRRDPPAGARAARVHRPARRPVAGTTVHPPHSFRRETSKVGESGCRPMNFSALVLSTWSESSESWRCRPWKMSRYPNLCYAIWVHQQRRRHLVYGKGCVGVSKRGTARFT